MKKMKKTAGMVSIAFLLVGCQSSEDEQETMNANQAEESPEDERASDENEEVEPEDHDDENELNEDNDDEPSDENEEEEDNPDTYGGTQETPDYFIDTHMVSYENAFYTAFYIKRDAEQDLQPEDRLERSLIDSDPSEQDILSSFTEMSVEWPTLYVNFNVDDNQLSATTAQSSLFYDSLIGISALYGIEEIIFLNPDGEEDIYVAERGVQEPIIIEDEYERGLTRGYYTVYDEELEQTLFLTGGALEEQVEGENGEPLSFSETVEEMKTVDHEEAFYTSAIVDGIEIVHATNENGVATVQYTMDDENVTEADQTVFENAIQLAALDFHVSELRLINDTKQEIITYPLVGQ
ncbi:hypothetical protein [Alkalicoccobacillus murimartini]|uniref:GerMN domain-containing protein n=1 Tax=Alkalicoccobacillus murimartini TaxID=171685 RepID=A0ABT9YJ97_9BACI|nr:hypothetical protein [Alkalicoccobacillus murimartini]MDQ0207555.1 hypothetical protein [Alkalicoccobacillus murimartini]